ncbi:MAG: glutamine--fructose-6-phosphate transaminase (isomerizing) [Bacillaceae bacterium]|nr:glutamine--fructose-6-phosphate transaminase (isomerizing) [Bacillaceae bacterium]
MCGIVGYIGDKQAQDVLINGLKKLEYRGYDSAGLAVYNGSVKVNKAKGRIDQLETLLSESPLEGTMGIGHTRWATHGQPSDENSHPHLDQSGKFAVVHNGIIENYLEIKEELMAKGYQFSSETDSEVISHLLADLYNGNLVATVQEAVKKIKGAYALAIISEYDPGKIVTVRFDSPLVIGVGEGENFVGSDIPAILEHTRNVYILENNEMAVLTRDSVEIMTVDGSIVAKDVFRVEWDMVQAEKGGYEHFLIKEIHEQPRAFRDTLASRISEDGRRVVLKELEQGRDLLKEADKIFIVACGTSYHAGIVAKYAMEQLARVPVEVDVASEFRYRNPIITDRTLVIVISQSGETADTLAALRESKKQGARVLAITNVVGSSVAREADDVIYTWAGPEVSVASTKAYTSQLVALYLTALYTAQVRETHSEDEIADLISGLQQLPEQAEAILEQKGQIKAYAEKISSHPSLFFIGRGIDYAVCMEGSLKLKEISYIHSEAYPAGELKHGTLALIEEGVPVVAIATQPEIYEKTISNIVEVKTRGAHVLGVGTEGDRELEKSVDETVFVPKTHPLLAPALSVIPLQLLAYYASVARGNDVDKPRNLAKSVTVE